MCFISIPCHVYSRTVCFIFLLQFSCQRRLAFLSLVCVWLNVIYDTYVSTSIFLIVSHLSIIISVLVNVTKPFNNMSGSLQNYFYSFGNVFFLFNPHFKPVYSGLRKNTEWFLLVNIFSTKPKYCWLLYSKSP